MAGSGGRNRDSGAAKGRRSLFGSMRASGASKASAFVGASGGMTSGRKLKATGASSRNAVSSIKAEEAVRGNSRFEKAKTKASQSSRRTRRRRQRRGDTGANLPF